LVEKTVPMPCRVVLSGTVGARIVKPEEAKKRKNNLTPCKGPAGTPQNRNVKKNMLLNMSPKPSLLIIPLGNRSPGREGRRGNPETNGGEKSK